MKKKALLIACLLGLCTLVSCGDTADKTASSASESSSESSAAEETTAEETENTTEETTEATTAEKEESEDETEASEAEKSDDSADAEKAESSNTSSEGSLTRGVVEDNCYTSTYANLKFTAPEGWVFANDEYMKNAFNMGNSITGADNTAAADLIDQLIVYDALCMDQSTGATAVIMFENLAKEYPDPSKFKLEDYIKNVTSAFTLMPDVECDDEIEPETVMIGSEEFTKFVIEPHYTKLNRSLKQTYFMRKIGDHLLGITISEGTGNIDADAIVKNFDSIN